MKLVEKEMLAEIFAYFENMPNITLGQLDFHMNNEYQKWYNDMKSKIRSQKL